MAYKKRTMKRRPVARRRRKVYRKKYAISRNPITKTLMVRMKYCDRFTINPSAGGVHAFHYFRWNSIFDPDYTATGHQPLGRDQYAALYQHYYVAGAKATVTFSNDSNTAGNSCIVGLRTDDDFVTTTNGITEITEQPGATFAILGLRDGGSAVRSVTKRFSTRKHFGSTKMWNRTNLGADMSTNPSTVAYLQVYAAPIDNSIDAGQISCYITIQYMVLLTDPQEIVQS